MQSINERPVLGAFHTALAAVFCQGGAIYTRGRDRTARTQFAALVRRERISTARTHKKCPYVLIFANGASANFLA